MPSRSVKPAAMRHRNCRADSQAVRPARRLVHVRMAAARCSAGTVIAAGSAQACDPVLHRLPGRRPRRDAGRLVAAGDLLLPAPRPAPGQPLPALRPAARQPLPAVPRRALRRTPWLRRTARHCQPGSPRWHSRGPAGAGGCQRLPRRPPRPCRDSRQPPPRPQPAHDVTLLAYHIAAESDPQRRPGHVFAPGMLGADVITTAFTLLTARPGSSGQDPLVSLVTGIPPGSVPRPSRRHGGRPARSWPPGSLAPAIRGCGPPTGSGTRPRCPSCASRPRARPAPLT
jgi:hypothetical protein